jgi:maleate cis-trans isomerase
MQRLGVLYPPCGAEFEYYLHGERLDPALRISLVGVRIDGGDAEHDPVHLRRTASLDNLLQAARVLQPLNPDAVMWACTSGSFIDGLAHARAQAQAMSELLGCPASSTSLAFVDALRALGLTRATVLASYPRETARAFVDFLAEAGVEIGDLRTLDAPSGPHAAALDDVALGDAIRALDTPVGAAVLVPDTAIPTLHRIAMLEQACGRRVLTANQVSLWCSARMLGLASSLSS